MNDMPERLPSRPLRNWFLAWHIHTGDPADVIAKGFDLDPVLVADLLSGEVPLMLPAHEARVVAIRLRICPENFWGARYGNDASVDRFDPVWSDFREPPPKGLGS